MAVAETWESFAVMGGTASGTLTGLLFVAVSLNRDHISLHTELRASAAQTLVLLILPLPVSVLLLTPSQPGWALGAELIAFAVAAAVGLTVIARGKKTVDAKSRIARLLDRRRTSRVTTLFLLVAGATEAAGRGGGLYWLVPAVLVALLGGVYNAWIFLIEQTD
jgi:hypothetical protein